MGLLLTTIAGLVIWIVLWAIGVKSFDAFLITFILVLLAATAKLATPYLPSGRSGRDECPALRVRPPAGARHRGLPLSRPLGCCTPEPGARRIAARIRAS